MAEDLNKKNAEHKHPEPPLSAGQSDKEQRDHAREKTGEKLTPGPANTTGSGPTTMTGDQETPLPEGHPEDKGGKNKG